MSAVVCLQCGVTHPVRPLLGTCGVQGCTSVAFIDATRDDVDAPSARPRSPALERKIGKIRSALERNPELARAAGRFALVAGASLGKEAKRDPVGATLFAGFAYAFTKAVVDGLNDAEVLQRAMHAPEPPKVCPVCGFAATEPRKVEEGWWTWNCGEGCNP